MRKNYRYPTVLTIAGFDGSGGAGIQGDIKTISALGCFATSVLTALPVQNTRGVRSIYPIPCQAVNDQLAAILEDIFPDAIKIGMVHTRALVETTVDALAKHPKIPLVFDPVMVASSGHRLIENETITAIVERLFPVADLLTPNIDEAAVLAEMPIRTPDDMYVAGEKIRRLGCKALLLKGGHLDSATLTSLYFDKSGHVHTYDSSKLQTDNTHGTGCTLSSAIASYLAQGLPMHESVTAGLAYTHRAIMSGMDVLTGKGNGPLNHFFDPQQLIKTHLN